MIPPLPPTPRVREVKNVFTKNAYQGTESAIRGKGPKTSLIVSIPSPRYCVPKIADNTTSRTPPKKAISRGWSGIFLINFEVLETVVTTKSEIKPKNIPKSYWDLQVRQIRERWESWDLLKDSKWNLTLPEETIKTA